jgi:hypothetical protein
MLQMPPLTNPTEQELQQQQMTQMMAYVSPLMIGYFALQVPAGLGLYWFIGNVVSIIQQSFVTGWGGVLGHKVTSAAASGGAGPGSGPKPDIGPKRDNGRKPRRPKK